MATGRPEEAFNFLKDNFLIKYSIRSLIGVLILYERLNKYSSGWGNRICWLRIGENSIEAS